MTSSLIGLAICLTTALPFDSAPGVQLQYQGSLISQGRESNSTPVKTFQLDCLVTSEYDQGRKLIFVLDEMGGGGWAWPERYGQLDFNPKNEITNNRELKVLHTHDETQYPLALPGPFFSLPKTPDVDSRWVSDSLAYTIIRSKKVSGHDCWEIEVHNRLGYLQTLFVEKSSGLIVKSAAKVVMGRGDRFSLEMELKSATALTAEQVLLQERPVAPLLKLQSDLKRGDDQMRRTLTAEQLALAEKVLADLQTSSQGTTFRDLTTAIANDVKDQTLQQQEIKGLAKRIEGQQAPEFQLTKLDGSKVADDEYKNKIVLLHFWSYRGERLKEPYGQVGYLDFLNTQSERRKYGLKIYGVAVDQRFANPQLTPAALRSARQLQEFFNLGYEITRDDGSLLQKFGDPRTLNVNLPLWVLIAPDGTVHHYYAGFYPIERNRGLKDLEAKVVELVKKQRAN